GDGGQGELTLSSAAHADFSYLQVGGGSGNSVSKVTVGGAGTSRQALTIAIDGSAASLEILNGGNAVGTYVGIGARGNGGTLNLQGASANFACTSLEIGGVMTVGAGAAASVSNDLSIW